MRIFLEGQDARAAYLGEMLKNHGHSLNGEGPWDLAVLSIPRSGLSQENAARFSHGQKIVCGRISEELLGISREKAWRLFPVLDDEAYQKENARLSAEGAVYYAMQQADFAFSGARCLILGYGRIGKALKTILEGLGAHVTVAARREESRREAGRSAISFETLSDALPDTNLLFNTVPSPVLGTELLSKLPHSALLVELASAPYGIDLSAAAQAGLRAWGEWGIPGRYCPQSAASILFDYLEREALL